MHWLVAGSLILGALCGATIRLMVFVVVLFGAAAIGIATGASHGIGTALRDALVAVVVLQIGYVAGLVLRSIGRVLRKGTLARARHDQPVAAPLGEKRR